MTLHFRDDRHATSWGRVVRRTQRVARPAHRDLVEAWNRASAEPRLAVGRRRSYGDTCLTDGAALDMTGLDRFIRFDPTTGILVAEAGLTLDALLAVTVPRGWFVPVTPGTRHVTLGGAVANDVHGKNHTRAGTFGSHVRRLTILRSDGRFVATPEAHAELFAATIGGLGLTGIVTEVELALQPVASAWLATETLACTGLDATCDALEGGLTTAEHNVAWIDCTARGRSLGRGLVTRANWCDDGALDPHRAGGLAVPVDGPDALLNPVTLKLFNTAYYAAGAMKAGPGRAHYASVFHPLDAIGDWNRLYGRSGFYQYQCVIPARAGRAPLTALMRRIAASGEGSFLAVLKWFGDRASPGLLSFPQAGWTFALDFHNRGVATLRLLAELDAIVADAGGRLYPAKDGRMSPALFRAGLPQLDRFRAVIDPACRSDFWTRMTS